MVVQHWRGFPSEPGLDSSYADVVVDLAAELLDQVRDVREGGVPAHSIVLDPGLGFALEAGDSWRVVESLASFTELGFPVLVGASRKRFVRERYGERLLQGTLDVTAAAVRAGAWGVRVHDVRENARLIEALGEREDQE